MNKQNQLTVWDKPDHKFLSTYGQITYAAWCELEIERAASIGRKSRIIKNDKGQIAIESLS